MISKLWLETMIVTKLKHLMLKSIVFWFVTIWFSNKWLDYSVKKSYLMTAKNFERTSQYLSRREKEVCSQLSLGVNSRENIGSFCLWQAESGSYLADCALFIGWVILDWKIAAIKVNKPKKEKFSKNFIIDIVFHIIYHDKTWFHQF